MKKIVILILALMTFVSAQTEKPRVVLVTSDTGVYSFKKKVEPFIADALKALDYRVFIVERTISNQSNYNDSNTSQVKQLLSLTKEFEPNFILISNFSQKNNRTTSVLGVTTYFHILTGKFFVTKPDGELLKNWEFDAEGTAGTAVSAQELSLKNLVNRAVPIFQEAVTPK